MVCLDYCGWCTHDRGLKDGWIPCCDAFPDGMPFDFKWGMVLEMEECNNGIGFELKKDSKPWWTNEK